MATTGARNSAPLPRSAGLIGDQLNTDLESVIFGLLRVTGKTMPEALPAPSLAFEPARDYGDVWALTELWNTLGVDRLRQVFKRTRHNIDVEALVRVMVLNRLCDPDSSKRSINLNLAR